jgi:tRNA dimethylallyltransferase
MLSNGLMDEVYNLSQKYGWGTEALKAVGYNEWHDYFLGSLSEQKVKEIIIKNTLNLAKRQRTWFRRNKSIQWFTTPVKYTDIVDTITTFLES